MPFSHDMESDASAVRYAPLGRDRIHLEVIAQWFLHQWGVPPAETIQEISAASSNLPAPVSALRSDELIGILTFKAYPVEAVGDRELWVNSLYVRPDCRGAGVGSQLLIRGMDQANQFGAERLYVYTDIPDYYSARGWREFKPRNADGMYVLEYLWP